MKTRHLYCSIGLFFCALLLAQAQVVDREKKSIRIPAVESPKEKDSSLSPLKLDPKNIPNLPPSTANNFKNLSEEQKKFIIRESEKPFSMFENDGLKDPGQLYVERWKKQAAQSGIIKVMDDQFLGQYNIDAEFVNIVCRDHEYPDGDRVRVLLNGDIVYRDVTLTSSYRRLKVNLAQGKNQLDILALNQGDSGPNTAEFVVYDDQGNIISSKEWNLLTGVKATIIFVNYKPEITRNSEDNNN
jgi:hypothetical protein